MLYLIVEEVEVIVKLVRTFILYYNCHIWQKFPSALSYETELSYFQ